MFRFANCYCVIFESFRRLRVWQKKNEEGKRIFAVNTAILFLKAFVTTPIRYQAF